MHSFSVGFKNIGLFILFFFLLAFVDAQNTMDLAGLTSATPMAGAFSLRKLSSSYSGNAIRVRRSSDNATQDIGFLTSGFLDTASLKTFVGISATDSGLVTIWYDQSGNARNVAQPTKGNQPSVMIGGKVNRYGNANTPTVLFNIAKRTYLTINFGSPVTAATTNAVAAYTKGSDFIATSNSNPGVISGGPAQIQLVCMALQY